MQDVIVMLKLSVWESVMSDLLFCNLLGKGFIEYNSSKLNLLESVTSFKFSALSSYAFPYIWLYKKYQEKSRKKHVV